MAPSISFPLPNWVGSSSLASETTAAITYNDVSEGEITTLWGRDDVSSQLFALFSIEDWRWFQLFLTLQCSSYLTGSCLSAFVIYTWHLICFSWLNSVSIASYHPRATFRGSTQVCIEKAYITVPVCGQPLLLSVYESCSTVSILGFQNIWGSHFFFCAAFHLLFSFTKRLRSELMMVMFRISARSSPTGGFASDSLDDRAWWHFWRE